MKNIIMAVILCTGITAYPQSYKFKETAPGVKMRYIGPGNGGSMFGMAINPTNSDIIIFGGDMGACYRTENGGKTWDILGGDTQNCPQATWNVKFHPEHPNIVWHAGNGLLKSTDTGKTWKNTGIFGTYCALGLDPDNTNIIYAAEGQTPRFVLNWIPGRVYKSTDGGKTWKKLSLPEVDPKLKYRNFTDFIIDTNSKKIPGEGYARVYLFGRGGLYRTDDAGKSWKNLSGSFALGQINDMAMIKKDKKTILFLSVAPAMNLKKGGIYMSEDNGETWTPANNGLEPLIDRLKTRNKTLAENPQAGIFTLLLARSKSDPNRLYAGSWQGIYRSDNAGKSWYELAPAEGCGYIKDKYSDIFIPIPKKGSHFKTSIWGGIDSFNCMIADDKNPDLLAFSDNQDMYISKNGGKLWDSVSFEYGETFYTNLYVGSLPNRYTHKTRSKGVQNLVCDQISVDPFDPETYYAAFMDTGLEISRDGGNFWEHPTEGIPARGHVWAVVADPGKEGRVFCTIGQKWGQPGGIYQSDDKGYTWQRIGLQDASMGILRIVVIDPKSPVNNRTIYIGSEKKGIYKSTDGGKTWQNITLPPTKGANNIMDLKIDPVASKKIYAGTEAGLFVSDNNGEKWTRLGKDDFEKVENISICQTEPSTIYVCAHYPGDNGYWGKAGFWRSADNGKTFTNITPAYFKFAGAIAVNPFDSKYVYACNNLAERNKPDQKLIIIRSKDGGTTWENIGDHINSNRSRHLYIDETNPGKFFVLTRFAIIECIDKNAPAKQTEKHEKRWWHWWKSH